MPFLQLEDLSVVSLIMELVLGCQKHSEKSQLALSNARLESNLGRAHLQGSSQSTAWVRLHQFCLCPALLQKDHTPPSCLPKSKNHTPVGSETALTTLQTPKKGVCIRGKSTSWQGWRGTKWHPEETVPKCTAVWMQMESLPQAVWTWPKVKAHTHLIM